MINENAIKTTLLITCLFGLTLYIMGGSYAKPIPSPKGNTVKKTLLLTNQKRRYVNKTCAEDIYIYIFKFKIIFNEI